ncbi:MAG TPA: hypothetical protein VEC76_16145 [Streptosporangiaceae bacterium]|nr:hypothetical protein [Streptosporangiaceae bacterium]
MFVRLTRNTGIWLPWWIALPALVIALAIQIAIVCIVVLAWLGKAVLDGMSAAVDWWQNRPSKLASAQAADRIESARRRQERFQASRQAYTEGREAGRQEHLARKAARREAARQPAAERRGRHHAARRARRGRLSWPGYGIVAAVAAFVTGIVLAGVAGGNQHSPLVTAGALLWTAAIAAAAVCVPAALWRKFRRTRPRARTVTPGFEAAHGLQPPRQGGWRPL